MIIKLKELTPFERLALLEINKEIKKCFGDFYNNKVKGKDINFSERDSTLLNKYVILEKFEVNFLNKKAEIEFPFLVKWKIGIKNDTILIYLMLEEGSRYYSELDCTDYKEVYDILIQTKKIDRLICEIIELFNSIMKNKEYGYKIITNKDLAKIIFV